MEPRETALNNAPSFSHAASAELPVSPGTMPAAKPPEGGRDIPFYRVGLPWVGTTRAASRNPYQFYLDGYRQVRARLPDTGRPAHAHRHGWVGGERFHLARGRTTGATRIPTWRSVSRWGRTTSRSSTASRNRARRQHLQPAFRTEVIMRQIPTMDGIIAHELAAVAGQPTDFNPVAGEDDHPPVQQDSRAVRVKRGYHRKNGRVGTRFHLRHRAGLDAAFLLQTGRSTGATSARCSRSSDVSWTRGRRWAIRRRITLPHCCARTRRTAASRPRAGT